ncbi:glycosyltransferase family 2 protein [Leuconostoc mesenteroides]|jgi:GT2 family glycosyltransferase|uniref:glycosyltransferase family 2 protein n=1 Tax=Leuconostoc mesenteroides TaxID=1245 RepID=UPI000E08EB5E|nr:glycosyltransferase family 2 protein [Leuconostoc mesenteroides]MBZ1502437.1 glycosyltransferase family 2 protein [Leuconostoc mesenteroides]MCH3951872.1 glycosyltransferase family 2 protein [Leuconostoc mesenteroides]MCH3979455.1 glycosyltransferase family 2 protein [Leuconostoc mesenteroides]MCI2090289.1 glycosyltransferase family 2 protein [Leuconostoc mesenteroides]MCI2120921.1 glycosyltransferase family 2 protein [Leuconostoc mesenteroides]
MSQNVSAVIVTFNRLTLLKEVIESLQTQDTKLSHIIVVDNNSKSDTQEYLTSLGNQIEYVRLPENIGGAGGFNKGVRYFMEHTTDDFVWLMDDDTVVHPDTLTELLKFADKQDQFGFLSSDVRWTDGRRALMNQPAPMNRLKVIPEDQVEPVQLQNATFVSLLVKREVVKKIGLPITEFFIWGDDIEYTERAGRVAPGYFVPSAKVTHKMAENVGSSLLNDNENRTSRYFYSYRNKRYYAKKRDFYRRNRALLRMWAEYFQIKFSNTERKQEKLDIFKKGFQAGKTFNPIIEFADDLKEK